MTTQDYYNLPPDENGWRMLPNGDKFKLGLDCIIGNYAYINACPAIGNDVSVSNNDKTIYLVTVINSAGDYLEHKLFKSLIEAEQCAKGFGSHCTIEIWTRVSNKTESRNNYYENKN